MANESEFGHEDLDSLIVKLVEPAQVSNCKLLDLLRQFQAQLFDWGIGVFLVSLGDEEHGVGQKHLQMVPESAHVLRACLEPVNKHE